MKARKKIKNKEGGGGVLVYDPYFRIGEVGNRHFFPRSKGLEEVFFTGRQSLYTGKYQYIFVILQLCH